MYFSYPPTIENIITQVNFPPFFTSDLQTLFEVNVGDAWNYTLPEIGDTEE